MSANRTGKASSGDPNVTDGAAGMDQKETYHLISSDKVSGTDVRRPNGDEVGTIDHLMIDKKSGHVAYAVMSFGGFLGLGESRRPVPWDALHYNEELDAYELDASDDQLKTAPDYADDDRFNWSDPDWNRKMRSHYRARGTGGL